jgi:hypothetical protein
LKVGFAEALTAEDMAAVAKKLLELALSGDIGAAKLLLAALIGPAVPIDPDQLDRHELEVRRRQPTELDELMLIAQSDGEPGISTGDENIEADTNNNLEGEGSLKLNPAPEQANTAAAGWELFAETRLEMGDKGACPLDFLWSKYTYWSADRGFPLLTETAICAWLSERGVVVKTSPYGLPGTARGVRVTD